MTEWGRDLDAGYWKTSDQLTVIGYQEKHKTTQEKGRPAADGRRNKSPSLDVRSELHSPPGSLKFNYQDLT
jgi:hypothetical protein